MSLFNPACLCLIPLGLGNFLPVDSRYLIGICVPGDFQHLHNFLSSEHTCLAHRAAYVSLMHPLPLHLLLYRRTWHKRPESPSDFKLHWCSMAPCKGLRFLLSVRCNISVDGKIGCCGEHALVCEVYLEDELANAAPVPVDTLWIIHR